MDGRTAGQLSANIGPGHSRGSHRQEKDRIDLAADSMADKREGAHEGPDDQVGSRRDPRVYAEESDYEGQPHASQDQANSTAYRTHNQARSYL